MEVATMVVELGLAVTMWAVEAVMKAALVLLLAALRVEVEVVALEAWFGSPV